MWSYFWPAQWDVNNNHKKRHFFFNPVLLPGLIYLAANRVWEETDYYIFGSFVIQIPSDVV